MSKKTVQGKIPLFIDLTEKSDDELIFLRIQMDKEFKKRLIKFSVAEIGETLAIDFFNNKPGLDNLQRSQIGTKNVDANSRRGQRYSIKTIKDGNKTGTVYPDRIKKDNPLFEYLLMVLLNEDYELKSLHRFSWEQFLLVRQWDKRMNAWYVPKTLKALKIGESIYE